MMKCGGWNQSKQFLGTLPMVQTIEDAKRRNIPSRIKFARKSWIVNDTDRSTLDTVKWEKSVLGSPRPEVRAVFHMRTTVSCKAEDDWLE